MLIFLALEAIVTSLEGSHTKPKFNPSFASLQPVAIADRYASHLLTISVGSHAPAHRISPWIARNYKESAYQQLRLQKPCMAFTIDKDRGEDSWEISQISDWNVHE